MTTSQPLTQLEQEIQLPKDAIGTPYIEQGNWLTYQVDRMSCDKETKVIVPRGRYKIISYDKETKIVKVVKG